MPFMHGSVLDFRSDDLFKMFVNWCNSSNQTWIAQVILYRTGTEIPVI